MRHTKVLNIAISNAAECGCIVCLQNLRNFYSAETYWRDAPNHRWPAEEQRKWARSNWRRYVDLLIKAEFHLLGKSK